MPPTPKEWLRNWFKRRGKVPAPAENYFESGVLDSLGAVSLVADIEKDFAVRFTDEHYRQPRFSTLAGLAELVAELSAAKPGPRAPRAARKPKTAPRSSFA